MMKKKDENDRTVHHEHSEEHVPELKNTNIENEMNEEKEQAVNDDIANEDEKAPSEKVLTEEEKIMKLKEEISALNDKYLRLYSDFENYKKRAARDRVELARNAGAEVFLAVLPILDDFDRASRVIEKTDDIKSVKEGINLIHSKVKGILTSKGLEEMKSIGTDFDTDLHDAVTNIEVESEDMKGKVVEEVSKGYFLNGKVLRHAKVIVGQ
jgi:molecular chaperone GrpE